MTLAFGNEESESLLKHSHFIKSRRQTQQYKTISSQRSSSSSHEGKRRILKGKKGDKGYGGKKGFGGKKGRNWDSSSGKGYFGNNYGGVDTFFLVSLVGRLADISRQNFQTLEELFAQSYNELTNYERTLNAVMIDPNEFWQYVASFRPQGNYGPLTFSQSFLYYVKATCQANCWYPQRLTRNSNNPYNNQYRKNVNQGQRRHPAGLPTEAEFQIYYNNYIQMSKSYYNDLSVLDAATDVTEMRHVNCRGVVNTQVATVEVTVSGDVSALTDGSQLQLLSLAFQQAYSDISIWNSNTCDLLFRTISNQVQVQIGRRQLGQSRNSPQTNTITFSVEYVCTSCPSSVTLFDQHNIRQRRQLQGQNKRRRPPRQRQRKKQKQQSPPPGMTEKDRDESSESRSGSFADSPTTTIISSSESRAFSTDSPSINCICPVNANLFRAPTTTEFVIALDRTFRLLTDLGVLNAIDEVLSVVEIGSGTMPPRPFPTQSPLSIPVTSSPSSPRPTRQPSSLEPTDFPTVMPTESLTDSPTDSPSSKATIDPVSLAPARFGPITIAPATFPPVVSPAAPSVPSGGTFSPAPSLPSGGTFSPAPTTSMGSQTISPAPSSTVMTKKPVTTRRPIRSMPPSKPPTMARPSATTKRPTKLKPTKRPTRATMRPTRPKPGTMRPTRPKPGTKRPTKPRPATMRPTKPRPATMRPTKPRPATKRPTKSSSLGVTVSPAPSSLNGTIVTVSPAPSSLNGSVVTVSPAPSSPNGTVVTTSPAPSSLNGTTVTVSPAPSSLNGTIVTVSPAPSSNGTVVAPVPSIPIAPGATALPDSSQPAQASTSPSPGTIIPTTPVQGPVSGGVTPIPTAGAPVVGGVTPVPTAGAPVAGGVTPVPTAGAPVAGGVTPVPTAGAPVAGGIVPPSVSGLVPPAISGLFPDALNTSSNVTKSRQIGNLTEWQSLNGSNTDLIVDGFNLEQKTQFASILNGTSSTIHPGELNNTHGQLRNDTVVGGVTPIPTAGVLAVGGVTPIPTAGVLAVGGVTPIPTAGVLAVGGVTPIPTAGVPVAGGVTPVSTAGAPAVGGIIPPNVSGFVPSAIIGLFPDAFNTSSNATRSRQIGNQTEFKISDGNGTDLNLDGLDLEQKAKVASIFNGTSFTIYQGDLNNTHGQLRNDTDFGFDVFELDQFLTNAPSHILDSSSPSFTPSLIVNNTMSPNNDNDGDIDTSNSPSHTVTRSPTSSIPSRKPTFVVEPTLSPSKQVTALTSEQKRQHENEVVKTITESKSSSHDTRAFHFSNVDLDEIIAEAKRAAGAQDADERR
jgi:hypothetical protein